MIITGAKVFTKDHVFQKTDIITKGAVISALSSVEDQADTANGADVLDATGLYAIPGLVDIHFHGAMGHDFCDADLEGLNEIARYEAQNGILAICPATMTYSEEILSKIMENASEYTNKGSGTDKATLVGINMEGPFISPKKIGAQNPKYLALPDVAMFKRLQEKSCGLIKLVDIAPELDGSISFIKELHNDVNISIAHTACTYEVADKAFSEGARHVTHLFNAMPGLSHREPGPIRAAMEAGAEVELIADGVHIHPSMVCFAFESFPDDKVILISDSMEATGLPDGEYQLGGQAVTVHGNKAVLTSNPDTIAGSATNLFDCMKSAIKMGIKKEAAITAASENPAKSIGIADKYGAIADGYFANILLVDEAFNLIHVINKGDLQGRG